MTPPLPTSSGPPLARKRTARVWLAGLALVAALASATAAGAAPNPREQAKVEFDKGQVQYRVGHFQEALEAYTRAYELFPAPALLFNIGQCHKNLQNHERAIFFFEGYLHDEANPARRALAQELLAESRAELERAAVSARAAKEKDKENEPNANRSTPLAKRSGSRSATTPPPLTPEAAAASDGAPAPLLGAGRQASAPSDEATPVTRTWWFWTAVGVAAIGVASGVIYASSGGGTTRVPPSSSLGTLDRRE
jgi:tetratricopeptide (TPR) repeat protein